MSYFQTLWMLLCGHALADYALQSEWMIREKNRRYSQDGHWWWVLIAHSLINGFFVFVITQSTILGLVETVVHGITDLLKCEDVISPNVDQSIHLISKGVYAGFKAY